jgi:hypothetical protein
MIRFKVYQMLSPNLIQLIPFDLIIAKYTIVFVSEISMCVKSEVVGNLSQGAAAIVG